MATIHSDFTTISTLHVQPTGCASFLLNELQANLDSSYDIFFQPYIDCDRPDIVIMKKNCGIFIIEVKDWNLASYHVDANGKWFIKNPEGNEEILSPYKQIFNYKKNLYDLHIPILGLNSLSNNNYFKFIHCYVFFSDFSANKKYIFFAQEDNIKSKRYVANQKFRSKEIDYADYSKTMKKIDSYNDEYSINRNMTYCRDEVEKLIKNIKNKSDHILFTDNIYEECFRIMSPPKFISEQTKKFEFSAEQKRFLEPKKVQEKIEGVSGSGKSTLIAARAVKASHMYNVAEERFSILILTFNITLKWMLKDYISYFKNLYQYDHNLCIEISNYHNFFVQQMNNNQIPIEMYKMNEKQMKRLFKSKDIFDRDKTIKYKSIYIDEFQDYEYEWIEIIRDIFLEENGEMVLFGDFSQNIYSRDEQNIKSKGLLNFGHLKKIKTVMRDKYSFFRDMWTSFQIDFLSKNHQDLTLIDKNTYVQQSFAIASIKEFNEINIQDNMLIFTMIKDYLHKYNIQNNDITIISSKKDILREIEKRFSDAGDKTITTFLTHNDLSEIIDDKKGKEEKKNKAYEIYKAEKVKKNFFVQNSDEIKISTIHSFKGMESDTVFFILLETDSPEIVYTAITRAKRNLIIFGDSHCQYKNFFYNFCSKKENLSS